MRLKHESGQCELALGLADVRASVVLAIDVRPIRGSERSRSDYSSTLAFYSPLCSRGSAFDGSIYGPFLTVEGVRS